MTILDLITFASYIALTVDVLFQIHSIRHAKSSEDISLVGLSIRYFAILIILYKFVTLEDWALVLGQMLLTVAFTAYMVLAFYYFKHQGGTSSGQ